MVKDAAEKGKQLQALYDFWRKDLRSLNTRDRII
jgi:hypothetical protein